MLPWPQFDVSACSAAINFDSSSARVRMTRIQTVEPGRVRPTPATQSPEQVVSGTFAWNVALRLKLDVARIVPLHGRVGTLAELRKVIGR